MADVPALLKRHQALLSQRAPWEDEWRDAGRYIYPRHASAIGRAPVPGERQTRGLYDSTAMDANGLLAAALHGTLTSPAIRWFRYEMRNRDLNRVAAVQQWAEACSNRVFSALSPQQSNWNAEAFEVYLDLGAFGTGALFEVEREDLPSPQFRGLLFRAIPIGTYCIAEDAEGRVDTIFYTFTLTASATVRQFGQACGERLLRLAADKPAEPVDLIHAVYPRPQGRPNAPRDRKPWASCYLWEKDKRLLRESGFDQFPFAVPRWAKAAGETYGRGPGHNALPDIRTLNKMTELELRAIAKAIDPPMLTKDRGVIGAIRLTPGGVTTTRDEPGKTLIPLESGAKFQVGQIKSSELKASIRAMFFNQQLQLPTGQVMTATEIERRYELMHRYLGPTAGRLEYEFSGLVVARAFALMFRRGALPPPPPEVLEAGQSGDDDLDVVSENPLNRAQKGSVVLGAERTFQIVLPMAQVDQTVLDEFDLPKLAWMIGEANGIPAEVRRSEAEKQARQAARAQQAQQEQSLQMAERMAGAAKDAAPVLQVLQGGKPGATPAPAEATAA